MATAVKPKKVKALTARRAELERMFKRHHGVVTLPQIVQQARSPDSTLHDWFEWDDTKAAEAHRLEQARLLLRKTYSVIEINGSGEVRKFRFAVSLPSDRDKQAFRRTVDVLSDEQMRAEMLETAKNEFLTLRKRWSMLTELAKIYTVIDNVIGK